MAPEQTAVHEIVEVFSAPDADPAWLLCDRHPTDAVAFSFVEPDGAVVDMTFAELRERSQRFAGLLGELGVGRGDRVATLMGKSADLVTVLLGTWRAGAVYVPLFTAFAGDAVAARLAGAEAAVVVADADQAAKVPDGRWSVLVAGSADLAGRLAAAEPFAGSTAIGGDGAFVHMFTSGTTGAPKGVVHPLRYVAGWQSYLQFALGVRDGLGLLVRRRPRLGVRAVLRGRRAHGPRPAQRPAARRLRRGRDLAHAGRPRGHRLRRRPDGVPVAAHRPRPGSRGSAPAAPLQRGRAADRRGQRVGRGRALACRSTTTTARPRSA